MKEKENLKRLKKSLLAAGLATVMATNPVAVQASIPEANIEHNVEDEKDVIARTTADWEKLKQEYSTYDCNLDTESIELLLEIEEFIDTNYSLYYSDKLSTNITVDDVIGYRRNHEENVPGLFNFTVLKRDYLALNKEDDKAKAEFLKVYGQYLADIHANNYFAIILILSAIRNDVAWYGKQDVENTDWASLTNGTVEAEAYRFDPNEYIDGKLSADLTTLELHYNNKDVTIDLTAPNDGSPLIVYPENDVPDTKINERYVGDGFVDIQRVYLAILKEANYLGKYFTGNLKEEDKAEFLGNSTFATNGTTIDATLETDQVYSILHNEKINELLKEGVRVIKTLSPATTYDLDELNRLGADVTALGYGHWYVGNPVFAYTYDENTKKYIINLSETIECPTKTYEEVIAEGNVKTLN